jgi:uncharacterized membrane protein HdeD (DUF308 family)
MTASEVHMATQVNDVPRHWWALGVRGLAAVIFGILAFVWPGITLAVLVLLFGAYALVDGVLALVSAVRSGGDQLWALLLEGVVGIAAGVGALAFPGLTAMVLLLIIAAWAILKGVLEVISAVRLRKVIANEWSWIVGGLLSVIFGLVLVAAPGTGALALVWLIGVYAILYGITLIALAWRVRELGEAGSHAAPVAEHRFTAG